MNNINKIIFDYVKDKYGLDDFTTNKILNLTYNRFLELVKTNDSLKEEREEMISDIINNLEDIYKQTSSDS